MKQFEEPEICIIKFDMEDVLTTSSGDQFDPGDGGLPIL